MPMFIGRKEALGTLGAERLGLLRECFDEAWDKYERIFRPALPLCSPIGMANILRELAIEEARARLTPALGFDINDPITDPGRFLAIVDGGFAIQFRKLTTDLRTRNNATQTSDAFDNQETGVEGVPDVPRLTAGYQLGQYRTSISEAYLAFIVGSRCQWYYNLRNGEHSLEMEFPETAGPSAAEQEAEQERRRKFSEENPGEEGVV